MSNDPEQVALKARTAAFMAANNVTDAELSQAVLGYARLVPFLRGGERGITAADQAALTAYLDAQGGA